jgi:hypothetical protein
MRGDDVRMKSLEEIDGLAPWAQRQVYLALFGRSAATEKRQIEEIWRFSRSRVHRA